MNLRITPPFVFVICAALSAFVILPFVFSPTAAPAYRETVLLIVPLLEPQIPPDFPSEDTLPEKKQSVIAPEF